jgi:ribosomal protein S18 acetylase RimI-like enzyme
LTLRKARREDASPLAALCIEVWLHTYCRPGIPACFSDYALSTSTRAAMERLIADPDEHLLVDTASHGDQEGLRGYLRWSCKTGKPLKACPAAEIVTLYVRERHKGQGIGSALLAAACAGIRESGERAAFLTPNAENHEAIAFYAHLGWEQIGETMFEIDGQLYPNLVLRKTF